MTNKDKKVTEEDIDIFFGRCCQMGGFLLGTLTDLANGEKDLAHLREDIREHVELHKRAIGDWYE
jgi:hypothetical protein|tara:strand:- start:260 stop:454 length:195 start_codon:yes stop_codon:yes gene_type:complete